MRKCVVTIASTPHTGKCFNRVHLMELKWKPFNMEIIAAHALMSESTKEKINVFYNTQDLKYSQQTIFLQLTGDYFHD